MPKVSINGEWKGYSTEKSIIETPMDHFSYMENMIIENGALRKRKPFSVIGEAGVRVSSNYYEYVYDGNRYIFFKRSAAFGYYSLFGLNLNSTVSHGTNPLGGTTENRIDFEELNGILYAADSSTGSPVKFYITTGPTQIIQPTGLPPPVLAVGDVSNLGVGTGGVWPGTDTYQYVVTFILDNEHQYLESNISNERAIIIADVTEGVQINLPTLPVVQYNITHWAVYRRLSGTGTFFRVNNSSTGFADIPVTTLNVRDIGATSSSSLVGPTRHNQLDINGGLVEFHKNRLWVMDNGNKLRFSEFNQPEYFPPDNIFLVGSDQEPPYRLISFPSFLAIIKGNEMWLIDGDNVNNFRLQKIEISQGGLASWAIIKYGGYIYWTNNKGIWRWNFASEPENIGRQIWKDYQSRTNLADSNIIKWFAEVEPTSGYIWFGIFDDLYCYIYNPEINKFIGVTAFKEGVNSIGEVGRFNNHLRMGVFKETLGQLYSYNEFLNSIPEPGVQIAAFTGMNTGIEHGRERLWRFIRWFDRDELTQPDPSLFEDIPVRTLDPNQSLYGSLLGLLRLNSTTQKVSSPTYIGITNQFLSFGFWKSDTNFSQYSDWAIPGMEVEFELIGNW